MKKFLFKPAPTTMLEVPQNKLREFIQQVVHAHEGFVGGEERSAEGIFLIMTDSYDNGLPEYMKTRMRSAVDVLSELIDRLEDTMEYD
jgi:hypothetical protein